MKTRNSSLAEKYGIYGAIGVVLILSLIGSFFIFRGYMKKISSLKAKKSDLVDEEKRNRLELASVLAENKKLNNQLLNKKSKIQKEQDLYESKKGEIESYLGLIPPYYMKPKLRKRIQQEAKSLNIEVLKYSAKQVDVSKFESMKFFPLQFSMDIQGDYGAIKQFIWFLDDNIILDDSKDGSRKWNFIVKVAENRGLSIVKGIPPSGMGGRAVQPYPQAPIQPPAAPAAPAPVGQQQTAEVSLERSFPPLESYFNRHAGLLKDEKMHLNLKLITYLRKVE